MDRWHYPRWIAHRGAGKLAPENTLAAFRLGAQHGWRMFECDVKLSADSIAFLLHDDTLNRTTSGFGIAGEQPWRALSQLDAGSWHSSACAGEPLPSLQTIAAYCLKNDFDLNIEIKPTPGTERHTGEMVARNAAQLWQDASRSPLLTSFSLDALEGAREAAPNLPRGLLLDTLREGWLETALMLGCVAVVCQHKLWDKASVAAAKSARLFTASYTVNDEASVQRLLALGIDSIITDRVDVFKPSC